MTTDRDAKPAKPLTDELLGITLEDIDWQPAREIHAHPCAHCPSKHPPDEMTLDILTWPRQAQLETVFRCAWRGDKACKGYCDVLNVTETELQEMPCK